MIAGLFAITLLAGFSFGALVGLNIGTKQTEAARDLACQREALAVLRDLVNSPDSLELRPRAVDILNARRKAYPKEQI